MCIDEFIRGVDEVLSDPALGDEVHYREEQERLVRRAMVGDLRVPVSASVGAKLCERVEVFVNHLSEGTPPALLLLIVETRSNREFHKIRGVPYSITSLNFAETPLWV